MERKSITLMLAVGASSVTMPASATEGGGQMYAPGIENFMAGAMPPPGMYGIVYAYSYSADKLRDNSGREIHNDFDLDVNVIAPRLIWVTNQHLLGGQLAWHVLVPFMDQRVSLSPAAGMHVSDHKFAQGDITFGPAIGYHYSQHAHGLLALDIFAPTGAYDVNDIANTGRNYWAVQPLYAFDYVNPDGLNFSAKVMYEFNAKNSDTHYKSGQEFIADVAVGWSVGQHWTLGVGGFVYRQTTDDKQYGQTIADYKGRAYALGPDVKYDSGKGWFVTGKYAPEFDVRNRPQGSVFTVKATFPL
ncbi:MULTISPECIES: SphA family protein [Gammaproteobacteria]|uniref:SphA family protein n=1 Tax=Gammaproteobacteria TaxID=1236 RepID=UPI0015B30BDE|nr:transporter [Pseudomonas sp. Hp2]